MSRRLVGFCLFFIPGGEQIMCLTNAPEYLQTILTSNSHFSVLEAKKRTQSARQGRYCRLLRCSIVTYARELRDPLKLFELAKAGSSLRSSLRQP